MQSEDRKFEATEFPEKLALPLLTIGAITIAIGAVLGNPRSIVGVVSLLLLVTLFATGLARDMMTAHWRQASSEEIDAP